MNVNVSCHQCSLICNTCRLSRLGLVGSILHFIYTITMGFYKSTLVARGANTQLDPSCISAPLVTNVDLFVCFPERLFKSSSISH